MDTKSVWDVILQWTDQYSYWVLITLIKEFNPIDISESTVAKGYNNETVFNWWVHRVINNCLCIIKKVKPIVNKLSAKFGVRVPTNFK